MAQLIWLPAPPPVFRALSGPCEQPPTTLDKETLALYAEKCGKDVALKWATKELGVDVGSCAKSPVKEIPECVANNYGITFDLVNKDGSVNWNNVVRDSGAVGGIIVCAATGAGAATLPLCGKLGAELAQAFVDLGKAIGKVGEVIIKLLWGSDEGGGYACGKSVGYVLPQYAARDIVSYLKTVKTIGGYPAAGSLKLGPVMPGTDKLVASVKTILQPSWTTYWGRVFLLRGMAQATASLIAEISRKANVSPAVAAQALAPLAPPGWSDLVRPLFDLLQGSPNKNDVMGNIGGLLDVMLYGTKTDAIRPSWQKPEFWSGIDTAASSDKLWRYFSITVGCPDNTVIWGEVQNLAAAQALLKAPRDQGTVVLDNKTASNRWNWWVYSMPKALDHYLLTTPDPQFKLAVSAWRASLEKGLPAKIAAARSLASSSSGPSVLPLVAGAGAAGALIWWLFF